jgi:hypothetical protein
MKKDYKFLALVPALAALGMPLPIAAEFAMNFTPINAGAGITTNSVIGCSNVSGQTPFLMAAPGSCSINTPEIVFDPSTGLNYYHMIVGSAAEGFIQESFIQTGVIAGTILSCAGNSCSTNLNNMDPLGGTGLYYTGNGASNPRGTIIRQIISDGEIVMEFLKDKYDRKPLITQTIITSEIFSTFRFDMRNSTYSDMNTPGLITNTLTFSDPGIGSFDMARDAPDAHITGGRYTYTNGTGNGGSQGTYNYIEGGGGITSSDWTGYMDRQDTRNIWTFGTYKPQ